MTLNAALAVQTSTARQHAGVFLDDRRRGAGADGFVVCLHRSPGVRSVFLEVQGRIDGVERDRYAGRDIRHVLPVEHHVLPGPEPSRVATDEVLPRIRQGIGGGLEVSGDVSGEVGQVRRRPARVDDVDEHEGVVVGQVDVDVVGRVVRPVPREVDPLTADVKSEVGLKCLIRWRPRRVVVAQQ